MRVRRSFVVLGTVLGAIAPLPPSLAQDARAPEERANENTTDQIVRDEASANNGYEISITGAPDNLREKLEIISDLKNSQRTYPTAAAFRRAASRDATAFQDALRAAGYYAGRVSYNVIVAEDGGATRIEFEINTGAAFAVTEYDILYDDEGDGRPLTLAEAGLESSGAADGATLRDLQQSFLNHLWESGYPSAEIVGRRAIANIDSATANAIFVFRSGPKAKFGDTNITGLDKTKPSYARKFIGWEEGAEYERSELLSYRDKLAKTGLFSTIDVAPGLPDETGAAPIVVELTERKRRTIGAGVSFSTAEGPGGRIFFENRNMFGRAENLRIELTGSEIEQAINFDLTKPLPGLPGRAFSNLEFSNETTDAFDARSLSVTGGLSKSWIGSKLTTSAAITMETSNVKTDVSEERTYFISAPLSAVWNSEDDALNPTKGLRVSWTVTPYTGTDFFTQSELVARSRVNFGANDRFTLAARGALGATFGDTFVDIPANKRLYAGGGGSVRGFGFQEAGPLDANNDPLGGRSLIEGAIEARAKITQNLQIAGFADAGTVSSSVLPDFNERFFIGYGGGIRYFTPIGPIRIDAAFPVDPRPNDRSFQLFIALGQPF